MTSILGKYNDRCRRPLAQEHGKAGAGWCSSALSQLAESSGGPRKVLGVSRTPDVWSQRQMGEEVDKAGENRRLLWRSRKLYSGPLECRWRTASYKETTARSSAGTHVSRCWFQRNKTAQAACGSTRGMARAGIGVFSEVTGACLGL